MLSCSLVTLKTRFGFWQANDEIIESNTCSLGGAGITSRLGRDILSPISSLRYGLILAIFKLRRASRFSVCASLSAYYARHLDLYSADGIGQFNDWLKIPLFGNCLECYEGFQDLNCEVLLTNSKFWGLFKAHRITVQNLQAFAPKNVIILREEICKGPWLAESLAQSCLPPSL